MIQTIMKALSHDLIAINQELCPTDLLEAAQLSWDEAVELGTKNGYTEMLKQQYWLQPELLDS